MDSKVTRDASSSSPALSLLTVFAQAEARSPYIRISKSPPPHQHHASAIG